MAWISGAIAAGGAILGSLNSSNASSQATAAQQQASQASILAQERNFNIGQQAAAPYQAASQTALGNLMGLMGMQAPKMTTPYGYSVTPQMTSMTPIYNLMGMTGQGVPYAHTPRTVQQKWDDPFNIFGGGLSGYGPGDLTKNVDPLQGGLFNHFGLAHGGTASGGKSGGSYVVGEQGPEILHMAPGSQGYVEPNSPKADAAAYGHRMYGGPVGPHTGDPIRIPMERPMLPMGTMGRFVAPRAGGGPVFGGKGSSSGIKWQPNAGYSTHAHDAPLSPVMHMGYFQPSSYGIEHRFLGGQVGDSFDAYRRGNIAPAQPASNSSGGTLTADQIVGALIPGAHVGTGVSPQGTPLPAVSGGNINVPASSNSPTMDPNAIMAQDPGYQFRLQQGQQALSSSAAASGNLLSGGFAKQMLQYGQNYASNEYQNIYNRLANIAGYGQVANNSLNYSSAMTGNGMNMAAMMYGNAGASGYMNQANAFNQGLGNLSYLYGSGAFGGGMGGSIGSQAASQAAANSYSAPLDMPPGYSPYG